MGRRGDHTYKQLNDMIIKAAYNLMEKEGYNKISTRKIAAEIGYTVGTLYNVFENLDDVFIHVNSLTLDKLHTALSQALKKAEKSNQKVQPIKALADAYIKFSQENFHLWCALFEYRFPDEQIIPRWYIEKINNMYEFVTKTIINFDSSIPPESIKEVVMVLWSAIHGICALSIKGKLDRAGSQSAQVLIDNFLKNYLRGLSNH